MALWILDRTWNGYQLTFVDAARDVVHDCGEVPDDTPVRQIHEWILNHCNPYDLIRGDQEFTVLPPNPHAV